MLIGQSQSTHCTRTNVASVFWCNLVMNGTTRKSNCNAIVLWSWSSCGGYVARGPASLIRCHEWREGQIITTLRDLHCLDSEHVLLQREKEKKEAANEGPHHAGWFASAVGPAIRTQSVVVFFLSKFGSTERRVHVFFSIDLLLEYFWWQKWDFDSSEEELALQICFVLKSSPYGPDVYKGLMAEVDAMISGRVLMSEEPISLLLRSWLASWTLARATGKMI